MPKRIIVVLLSCILMIFKCSIVLGSEDEPTVSINNRPISLAEEITFDNPDESIVISDSSATYDNVVFRNGGGSLKLERTNKDSYYVISKRLSCVAGEAYFISAWLKSENLQDGRGTFAMEFYDSRGYISGSYLSTGATGTTDWTRYQTMPYRVPDYATTALIVFYITKGAVGKVWFDDVKIYREISDIMQTTLVTPGYRGVIWEKSNADIRLSTKINTNDYNTDNYKAVYRLVNESGEVVNETKTNKLSNLMDTTFSSTYLPDGKYTLNVDIIEKATESSIQNEKWPIDVKASNVQKPKSYVDEYGQFILDNSPFFPLGMYFTSINSNYLATYSNSPFNTILPYGAPSTGILQEASTMGIKIIYSVKDSVTDINNVINKVNLFKSQPALLAWYINDERDINQVANKENLLKVYNAVKSNDQDHPTFGVDFRIPEVSKQPMVTDIFGTDIYPVYGKSSDRINGVAESTRASVKGMPNRPVWQVVQVMNQQNYTKDATHRAPTYEELRNMTWQTVCEGAQGIIYYSWFDIINDSGGVPFDDAWNKSKSVAQEVKDLIPVIMSKEFTPAITVDGGDWLSYIVKNYGNKTYIFATNNTKTANLQATFNLPSNATVKNITDNSTIITGANNFTDTFPELGVRMYEVTLDENLSSNTDIKALSLSYNTQPVVFNVDGDVYKAYVPASVSSMDLAVSLKDENAKLTVNGNEITAPTNVLLTNSTNNITLEVTAKDGKTKNTVNIIIEKILLTAPSAFSVTQDGNEILLTWSTVNGAQEYELDINGRIHTISTNEYRFSVDIPGSLYKCRVRVKDPDNIFNDWSKTVNFLSSYSYSDINVNDYSFMSNGYNISSLEGIDNILLQVNVGNKSLSAKTVQAIIAVYDFEITLKTVKIIPLEVPGNGSCNINENIILQDTSGLYYLKLFIWEGQMMKPSINVIRFPEINTSGG